MKRIIILTLISWSSNIYSQPCAGQTIFLTEPFQCNLNPWVLVFEDNFDGNSLDLTKWEYGPKRIRICNNEQQYYTSGNNIEVSNGSLKLIAKEEVLFAKVYHWKPENEHLYCNGNFRGINARWFNYTSANIQSIKKFPHGRFEAKIKIPKGRGFWPAFWTYAGNPVYNEIDILEFWGIPPTQSTRHRMNIHYDYGDGRKDCATNYNGTDFSQDFHIFGLIWDENKIEWFVDGVIKRTDTRLYSTIGQPVTVCPIPHGFYVMNKIYTMDPMRIILNLAIRGDEEDDGPDSSTPFPSQMEVEWVRYYQRHSCQDISIIDATQYPLDNTVFNVIVGDNINIHCNYIIQSGQQLDIIAKSSITLGPGFIAESGSTFSARMEPTVCGSN